MGILTDDEVAKEIAHLEQELGRDYKVIDLTRSPAEIETELSNGWERKFVRGERAAGAQIVLVSLKSSELWLKPEE